MDSWNILATSRFGPPEKQGSSETRVDVLQGNYTTITSGKQTAGLVLQTLTSRLGTL